MDTGQKIRAYARRCLPRGLQHYVKKLYYPRVLHRFHESDWPAFAIVKALVNEGDCVVDAGANVGYISMLLSRRVGREGCVYSFEPVPDTFDLLANNVKRLRLENVKLHNCGLSSQSSSAIMEIPQYASGGENLYESKIVEKSGSASETRTVPVKLKTLDSVLSGTDAAPSFIKIDVEGHELQMLEGARTTIEACRPALLIEIADDSEHGDSGAQVFRMLAGLQYAAYGVEGARLEPCSGPCGKVDYLFIHPGQLDKLSAFVVRS